MVLRTYLMLIRPVYFFKVLRDKSLVLSKEEYKGGKRSKERFTVFLCVNWNDNEKFKLLVIGKIVFP